MIKRLGKIWRKPQSLFLAVLIPVLAVLSFAGERTMNVQASAGPSAVSGPVTVGELKAEKMESNGSSSIEVPMYTMEEGKPMGYYQFSGGDIINIDDQTFEGLPYRFARAEIRLLEGATWKVYPINYYDKIGDRRYYSVDNGDGPAQDFEIANEVPDTAEVSFRFQLNTKEYKVNVIDDKKAEGFGLEFILGFTEADGSFYARHSTHVKVKLTYPAGYHTVEAPGITPVGIIFGDASLQISKSEDEAKREITYSFIYPDKSLDMTVVGDRDDGPLICGVYEGTGNMQNTEAGDSWIRKTDETGSYSQGDPYYGTNYGGDYQAGRLSKPRGSETKEVLMGTGNKTISTGTFGSSDVLHFEYHMKRAGGNGSPTSPLFFFWPSPTLTLSYFPNGVDYSAKEPIINETFNFWDPSWEDTSDTGAAQITENYTAGNGAQIKIEVKKAHLVTTGTVHYDFRAIITISNMKNSFYLQTQSASSVQGSHYFRGLDKVSLATAADKGDSYLMLDPNDTGGAGGSQVKKAIKPGGVFLDKQSIANKEYPSGTGIPGAADDQYSFKFGVTPEWGYTHPRVLSFDENGEVTGQRAETIEAEMGGTLTPGSYSWFNEDFKNRGEISPFQYVLFMRVSDKGGKHSQRAIDITTEKISGQIVNNAEFVDENNPDNVIVKGDGSFDLLEDNNRIVFSDGFKAPKREGETFVGFTIEIKAKDNPFLNPDKVVKTLYKNKEDTDYFRPGDTVSLADYYRRDSADLLDIWKEGKGLNADEQERLELLMYTAKLELNIKLNYKPGENVEGSFVTGHVNKYLQDVEAPGLSYLDTASDSKSTKAIIGTNIVFSKFAETYDNAADHHTYYLNSDNTTSVPKVTEDDQELARVAYDRGLTVTYLEEDGSPFTGIEDPTVYRTYDGHNRAAIQFPTASQCPAGKVLDYWTVKELDDSGGWVPKPGYMIKQGAEPAAYEFASGPGANNKSIQLQAVWKDITPDSYITIPRNILLSEAGTNLQPEDKYAGVKVTIGYEPVNGNEKEVNVDVLKSFDLSLEDNPAETIKVFSYDAGGNKLDAPGTGGSYARAGTLGGTARSKDIWFNTETRDGNGTYKGTFSISSDPSDTGQGTLFYISAVSPSP